MSLKIVGRTIPSRHSDPETSHRAEKESVVRAGTQRALLLAVFVDGEPLIAEEAMELAGVNPRSCWWKRCSDLRNEGYLTWAEIDRGVIYQKKSTAGEWCNASVITEKGRQALRELEES